MNSNINLMEAKSLKSKKNSENSFFLFFCKNILLNYG